jgi:hypothetical protein
MESPIVENLLNMAGESGRWNGSIVPCVVCKPDDFRTELISSTPSRGKFFN